MHPTDNESAVNDNEQRFTGHAVSAGVGQGRIVHLAKGLSLNQIGPERCTDPTTEKGRFAQAVLDASAELARVTEYAQQEVPEEVAIFDAMQGLLCDETFAELVRNAIDDGSSAPWALKQVISHYEDEFSRINNPYLRERLSELENVGVRIISQLWGSSGDRQLILDSPSIVVTYDLSATELLGLNMEHLKGLVLEKTYKTAHVVILAKSLNIPVVSGVKQALQRIPRNAPGIVDGDRGMLWVTPTPETVRRYTGYADQRLQITVSYLEARAQPAQTADGVEVGLRFNIGTLQEISKAKVYHAGGIGLFRTELIFLKSSSWPTEDEQLQIYREALELADGHPVVFRTLDVGGDKSLPYDELASEDDSFLGWRGIRRSLDDPERFELQLRAILRASAFGNAKIMLPFITTVAEVEQSRALLEQAKSSLRTDGVSFDTDIELGIMVETPAVAWQADVFAQHADFFSIGTNDLIQFIVAAGRSDEHVEKLFDMYHQAVLRAIMMTCDGARLHGIPVSVCGEAAATPAMALFLIGCGVEALSMTASQIPPIKQLIRSITLPAAKSVAEHLRTTNYANSADVRDYLQRQLRSVGFNVPPFVDTPATSDSL